MLWSTNVFLRFSSAFCSEIKVQIVFYNITLTPFHLIKIYQTTFSVIYLAGQYL